jgi:hypothetical protein
METTTGGVEMAEKHTPGPWKAWHFLGAGWQISTADHADDETRTGYGNVGGVAWHSGLSFGGPDRFERAKANAHLIAAAPDMYEALEALLEVAVGKKTLPVVDVIHQATTALRKAKGEA